jgi:hypothetical protein
LRQPTASRPGVKSRFRNLLLSCHASGTNGSLTYRYPLANLASVGCVRSPSLGSVDFKSVGWPYMRLVHVCYAALGFAVARWIFKREPVPANDPVTFFRTSGLL